jgi:phosphatidylglycerophosphate synthase
MLGLGSAWCFYQGGYQMGVSGAGLLLLSIWIDGVDGEVARIKFMESKFGEELDIICDNVVHIAIFISIGMGLFHISNEVIFIYLGLMAALGSLIAFLMLRATIIDDKSKANSISKEEQKNTDFIKKLANRDFTHFLFLLALVNQLEIFIWMTAIGVNLLAVFLLFSKLRLKFVTVSEN